jgi:hypothetical protein
MFKILNISNKEYKLEYSLEASLYPESTERLLEFMSSTDADNENDKIKGIIKGMSNVPQTTLHMFYAGLLEHHGNTENGDGTVTSLSDAKALLKQYIAENKSNFYSVMEMILEQMSEDGFLELIGLNEMLQTKEETPKKASKIPQDHMKKK